MASLIIEETTGAREFHVPFDGPIPGWPWRAGGELVIRAEGPEATATAIELRFQPAAFEFQARLPELARSFKTPLSPWDLGRAAAASQPVVVYAAEPEALAAVPPGLTDLPAMERFLQAAPPIFKPQAYHLAGVAFESGETREP